MSQWNKTVLGRIAEIRDDLRKGGRSGYSAIYNISREELRKIAASTWGVELQDLEPPLRRQRKAQRKRIKRAMERWGKEKARQPKQRAVALHRKLCRKLSLTHKPAVRAFNGKWLKIWKRLLDQVGDCP